MKKKNVVVAMSGGVDSSVAAVMLKEQGYNVIGMTMKLWNYEKLGIDINHESGCCSLDSVNDARNVCNSIDSPYYVVNFAEEFDNNVIDNFVSEYLHGRTPNPCVMCNTTIKWDTLVKKAFEIGADFVATGHYARIGFEKDENRFSLLKGLDDSKDQSYALWGVQQHSLEHTMLPLGELTKKEVRALAHKYEIKTADKPESQEICFIPDNDYEKFLKKVKPELEEEVAGGKIIGESGEELGTHRGFPFYTIGQRRRIGITTPEPIYVNKIDFKTNTIHVGSNDRLLDIGLTAKGANWVSKNPTTIPFPADVKIRYNSPAYPGTVYYDGEGNFKVIFDEPQRAVTPGQSLVIYENDKVVAGAFIEEAIKYD